MKDERKREEQPVNELVTLQKRTAETEASEAGRKRMGEALGESEERYRELFDDVPIGIYRTTPDGHTLMANPALVKMLGYSSFDELALRNLEREEFYANYSRKQFKELVEREGEVKGLEFKWTRRDGTQIFVRENTRVIRREDGTVLYYEGTVEDITEQKRAEEALNENLAQLSKKNRYEEIINTVTRSVHRSINLQDVLENAVEAMSRNIDGVNNVSIYLVEGQEAVLKAYRGYPDWWIKRVRIIPYPKGFTWKTIIDGKPLYCPDVDQDTVIGPAGREMGTKSYASMPIHFGGKVVGCIDINSLQKNAFNEEELRLLEIVARQIEVAINNAQQAEALRRSEEALRESLGQLSKKSRYETIIRAVTQSVHQSINLRDVLENAVDAMSKNIDKVGSVAIYLVEGKEAVIKTHRGFTGRYIERAGRIPHPKGATWKTIIEGEPVYVSDVDRDKVIGPAGREMGIKSYVTMPVHSEDRAVGVIGINSFQKNAFDEDELRLLEIVARQIEVAIGNAQQAEELRRAKGELELRVQERTKELSKTNEELKREIAERKRVEKRIKESLREKEVLLREIHHRVKNNLQIILSLLNLQSRRVRGKKVREELKEGQNRVKSMAIIHEKLYQSANLAGIDFGKYAEDLSNHLFRSYGVSSNAVKLKIHVDDVFLGIDTAVPCGLILNELVSNSLKHAFPGGRKGEIRIGLNPNGDGNFTLTVSDNGVGLPKDFDFRGTKTLGLQLVCTLTNQLEGTIGLDRGDRTTFKIVFGELRYKYKERS